MNLVNICKQQKFMDYVYNGMHMPSNNVNMEF